MKNKLPEVKANVQWMVEMEVKNRKDSSAGLKSRRWRKGWGRSRGDLLSMLLIRACSLATVWIGRKKGFDGGGGDRVGYGLVIQVQLSKSYLKLGCAYLECIFIFERWESWEIWTVSQCKHKTPCCAYKTWKWYTFNTKTFQRLCSMVVFTIFCRELQSPSLMPIRS